MKAFQFVETQEPAQLREVKVPEPGPGQVLMKIGGAGACHSDLHIMEAPAHAPSPPLPFTLGHENAGWVEELGSGATGFAIGDPVLVYGPWGCGSCANCRIGMENYCQNPGQSMPGGLGADGGMANYMLVPSTRFLLPLGDLDPREAAPLTDAALTSYHAVKRSIQLLGPGSTAVVIGAGGLGQMAIQVLKALSAATTVIAVDTSVTKLETARHIGVDETVVSGADAVQRIRDITRGRGAALVLDMVGGRQTLEMAAQISRVLGHVTIVGLGGGALPVNFHSPAKECSVTSPYWGSIPELMDVICLAQAGRIKMLVEQFPLERASEAYHLLHDGKIQGRAVIIPNG
ncbi:NAD(P)-dependent alcohol dehydrogenase [Pseudonocardia sp.]|jgi:propanol-preferring alcohol dehydrogenase|uniref:NAD(P)-dependent alcohol dehydrogenase n=1 Tax=Pseudonocardia sp. TaxID=60912 RepID=UPI0026261E46|nr:NAD(P)-dependent alcohol dehydrogenase [Pseudonocardia sp.]MCW2721340.1 alcohol dehydrogenase [Pseudonocardia sp.]MDT7613867.1 alcohol dehydrogenase, propanol-preferring [Pseudonocardiales bacterium]